MTEWRKIYDRYEVSDDGQVRSLDWVDSAGHRRLGKLLKPYLHNRYLSVNINKKSRKYINSWQKLLSGLVPTGTMYVTVNWVSLITQKKIFRINHTERIVRRI